MVIRQNKLVRFDLVNIFTYLRALFEWRTVLLGQLWDLFAIFDKFNLFTSKHTSLLHFMCLENVLTLL